MRLFLEILEFTAATAMLTYVVIKAWRLVTHRDKRMERREDNARKTLAVAKSEQKVLVIKKAAKDLDEGGTK
jgi:hypothetical protein